MAERPTDLPVIAQDDYESFRRILGNHIADTYDKWLDLFANWERQYGSGKDVVRQVKINSNEFSQNLAATGAPANVNHLLIFTEKIAHDHHY